MSLLAFMTALLSLLLAPGPTNTLMAVAGADGGLRQVWRLIPAEVAGYLLVVVPLAFLGAEVAARWPLVSVVVTVAASVWVLLLAVRLWSASSRSAGEQPVSARRILVTTLLNPKALVFGLVLLPPPSSPELFLSRLAMFCGLVTATALVWGVVGRIVRSVGAAGEARLRLVQRAAALWLAVLSIMLAASVVRV